MERASNQVQETVHETLQEGVIAAEPEIEAIKDVAEVLRNAAAEGAMAAEAAAETVIVAPAAATVRNAPKTKRSAG